MFFNAALLTGLLLAYEVLAVPSGLGVRLALRRSGHQSQKNQPHQFNELPELDASAGVQDNWGGAVWDEANGTFTTVTGTFTVPTLSGTFGTYASAWVGIDGDTCSTAILRTGVDFTVYSDGQTLYNAWCERFPEHIYNFSGIDISAGDVIKLTVQANSTTSGTATIENLTTGVTVWKHVHSSTPLCGQNAEWIVQDFVDIDNPVPFANFGNVTFTDAKAGSYTPSGATLLDIKQYGKVMTSVSTNGSSVTITYL